MQCRKCSSKSFYEDDGDIVCLSCGFTHIQFDHLEQIPEEQEEKEKRELPKIALTDSAREKSYKNAPLYITSWERYRRSDLYKEAHARHRQTWKYKETQKKYWDKQKFVKKLAKIFFESKIVYTCPLKLFKEIDGVKYNNPENCDLEGESCTFKCCDLDGGVGEIHN